MYFKRFGYILFLGNIMKSIISKILLDDTHYAFYAENLQPLKEQYKKYG